MRLPWPAGSRPRAWRKSTRRSSHLDGVTQQNAALVEQSSAAAAALQQQAHHLAEVADTFRLEEQAGLRRPDLTALR